MQHASVTEDGHGRKESTVRYRKPAQGEGGHNKNFKHNNNNNNILIISSHSTATKRNVSPASGTKFAVQTAVRSWRSERPLIAIARAMCERWHPRTRYVLYGVCSLHSLLQSPLHRAPISVLLDDEMPRCHTISTAHKCVVLLGCTFGLYFLGCVLFLCCCFVTSDRATLTQLMSRSRDPEGSVGRAIKEPMKQCYD